MTSYAWPLASTSGGGATSQGLDARRTLFGQDLDWRKGALSVTGAGDWMTVEGIEALRQSVLRRLQTPVNGWATRPGYGCGVEEFIEEEMTSSRRAELINRIKSSLTRDPRIDEVAAVQIGADGEVFVVRVSIRAKGQVLTLADFRFNEAPP